MKKLLLLFLSAIMLISSAEVLVVLAHNTLVDTEELEVFLESDKVQVDEAEELTLKFDQAGESGIQALEQELALNEVSTQVKSIPNVDDLQSQDQTLKTDEVQKEHSQDFLFTRSIKNETLLSGFEQRVTGSIQGSANSITPEKGMLIVRIPRAAVGSVNSIEVSVDSSQILIPLDYYQEGSDIIFPFQFAYEILSSEAIVISFAITFFAATVAQSTTHTVSMSYDELETNDEFTIIPINSGRPIFSKLYYGARRLDENNNPYGLLAIHNQSQTNVNKFALILNYDGTAKENVIIQDILPEGTTLAPNPSAWDASGNSDTIAGGIRILEVTNAGQSDSSFHFVSEQFVDKVHFDSQTNVITVNFGDIPEDKAYMIEYAVEVIDIQAFNNGKDIDGFARNRATMSYDDQFLAMDYRLTIDSSELLGITLGKRVDKQVLNLGDNSLEYTLTLNLFPGFIMEGTRIEDKLDSRLEFIAFTGDIPDYLSVTLENNTVIYTFSQSVNIQEHTRIPLSFKVHAEQLAVGEQVVNYGEFIRLINDEELELRIRTADVVTKRIDGRIHIEKVDEEGNNLAGAKFDILNSDGVIVEQGITDESGLFMTKPLPMGRYQITEIEAPDGFLIEDTVYEVFINENSVSKIHLVIENQRMPEESEVTVKYVTNEGVELTDSIVLTGQIDLPYETQAKEFEGWTLIEMPENATGVFTKEVQEVIYVYESVESEVTVKYVTNKGVELRDSILLMGQIDLTYETQAKEFKGWTLIEMPENATGVFTKEVQEVIYVYESVESEVTVKYVTNKGVELRDSILLMGQIDLTYETQAKEFKGWKLIEMPENATGIFTKEVQEVIYVYESVESEIDIVPVDPDKEGKDKLPDTGQKITIDTSLLGIGLVGCSQLINKFKRKNK